MSRNGQANAPAVVGDPEPTRSESPVHQMIRSDSTPTFSNDERQALTAAYALLTRIAQRAQDQSENAA